MNVLITGANGFIGKELTKKMLQENHNVYGIVTSLKEMDDIKDQRLKCFSLFFEDYNQIAKLVNKDIDIVYHLAWDGFSGPRSVDIDVQLNNVRATYEVLEQSKRLNAKKFVFASTMNVLEVRNSLIRPTEYLTRGVYIHVASKINSELVARTFCEANHIEYNEGIVGMAYGEGNAPKTIPNIFLYCMNNNISPKVVKGEGKYDLVYKDDIVDAFIAIGKKGINKKTYYIGHNWNKSFKEIFTEIRDILKPGLPIQFGAYPGDNDIDFSTIDRDELTRDTGWMIKCDFKQSIIITSNWLKKIDFRP